MSEKYELYFFEQLSKLVYMNPTFIRRIYSYNCLSTNWPDTVMSNQDTLVKLLSMKYTFKSNNNCTNPAACWLDREEFSRGIY